MAHDTVCTEVYQGLISNFLCRATTYFKIWLMCAYCVKASQASSWYINILSTMLGSMMCGQAIISLSICSMRWSVINP